MQETLEEQLAETTAGFWRPKKVLQRPDVLRELSDPLALLAEAAELARKIVQRPVRRAGLRRELLLRRAEGTSELGPELGHGVRKELDLTLSPLLGDAQLRGERLPKEGAAIAGRPAENEAASKASSVEASMATDCQRRRSLAQAFDRCFSCAGAPSLRHAQDTAAARVR